MFRVLFGVGQCPWTRAHSKALNQIGVHQLKGHSKTSRGGFDRFGIDYRINWKTLKLNKSYYLGISTKPIESMVGSVSSN